MNNSAWLRLFLLVVNVLAPQTTSPVGVIDEQLMYLLRLALAFLVLAHDLPDTSPYFYVSLTTDLSTSHSLLFFFR